MWIAFSYSLCFSTGSAVLGNADRFWLIGTRDTGNQKSPYRLAPNSAHALAPTIPESVFIVYQATFAIITAVLVCGSFAERMSFRAMLIFIFFWHIIVYCPVAHSSWAVDGWLALKGDLDFAGGNVVHVSSGMSGLAASLVIGPRRGWGVVDMKPHNIVYTVIGASLLWVGWFGFNAGSAVSAGTVAGFAMLVTHICAATGGFVWMTLEHFHKGKSSVIGIVSGAVTGLVLITPAAGFVDQTAAFAMGLLGTPLVYIGIQCKHRMGFDDALDAFGVHGVGGVVGGILTGLFANDFVSGSDLKRGAFYGRGVQLGLQIAGVLTIGVWAFFASLAILLCLRLFMPLRVSETQEVEGLDLSEHGESMIEAGKAGFLPVGQLEPHTAPGGKSTVHPDVASVVSNTDG
jgi:ammonium transporter, Amt family